MSLKIAIGAAGPLFNSMHWISLIDFGLVVLIWMVQLVVYPSLKYYPAGDLLRWHRVYTANMTVVVLPLMLAQLILHAWRAYSEASLNHGWILLLVISTWLLTFAVFVPLHGKIAANRELASTLSRLVAYNWIRTVIWSLIFVCGLGVFEG